MSLKLENFNPAELEPINLEIGAGSCAMLSGPSGSGKSLILRAIADIIPHQGEVYLDDVACSSIPAPLWRSKVGLLPAESQWWHDRVGEHFSTAMKEKLPLLGLDEEAMEWQVSRCSTGEKQRLALLRLLENQPEVLLLDESTAALDSRSVQLVEKLVRQYIDERQATVLWVSHDEQQIARMADVHFVITDQKLQEVSL